MILRTSFVSIMLGAAALSGCAPLDPTDTGEDADDRVDSLTSAEKKPRYERIREAARANGIPFNGYLFA
ncbi:MAG: hypothetical protein HOV80_24580, partial [Polyangiaceae bacterium]|nr:hypothetical protein [Polyangiaceae bacterium]